MIWFIGAILLETVAAGIVVQALKSHRDTKLPAWFACSVVTALSPCLVPTSSPYLRLLSSLWAIALLVKLYDLLKTDERLLSAAWDYYLAWLPNVFWLVLRRQPEPVSGGVDWRRLPGELAKTVAGLLLLIVCFLVNWAPLPFFVEHCVKALAVIAAMVPASQLVAVIWRLMGGKAEDPMRRPFQSATPAEFWKRWNLPAQEFLFEHAYRPAARVLPPAGALLVTFAVSGLIHEYVFGIASGKSQSGQMAFFLVQGFATAATNHLRPTGSQRRIAQGLTITFQLVTSLLFFQGVNSVVPFYVHRGP